jgi:hypothetical protein
VAILSSIGGVICRYRIESTLQNKISKVKNFILWSKEEILCGVLGESTGKRNIGLAKNV